MFVQRCFMIKLQKGNVTIFQQWIRIEIVVLNESNDFSKLLCPCSLPTATNNKNLVGLEPLAAG